MNFKKNERKYDAGEESEKMSEKVKLVETDGRRRKVQVLMRRKKMWE